MVVAPGRKRVTGRATVSRLTTVCYNGSFVLGVTLCLSFPLPGPVPSLPPDVQHGAVEVGLAELVLRHPGPRPVLLKRGDGGTAGLGSSPTWSPTLNRFGSPTLPQLFSVNLFFSSSLLLLSSSLLVPHGLGFQVVHADGVARLENEISFFNCTQSSDVLGPCLC